MTQKDSLTPGLHPARLRHIRESYEASKLGHAFIGHPSYDEQIAIIDALLASEAQEHVAYIGKEMLESLRDKGGRSTGRVWRTDTDELSGELRIPL